MRVACAMEPSGCEHRQIEGVVGWWVRACAEFRVAHVEIWLLRSFKSAVGWTYRGFGFLLACVGREQLLLSKCCNRILVNVLVEPTAIGQRVSLGRSDAVLLIF